MGAAWDRPATVSLAQTLGTSAPARGVESPTPDLASRFGLLGCEFFVFIIFFHGEGLDWGLDLSPRRECGGGAHAGRRCGATRLKPT